MTKEEEEATLHSLHTFNDEAVSPWASHCSVAGRVLIHSRGNTSHNQCADIVGIQICISVVITCSISRVCVHFQRDATSDLYTISCPSGGCGGSSTGSSLQSEGLVTAGELGAGVHQSHLICHDRTCMQVNNRKWNFLRKCFDFLSHRCIPGFDLRLRLNPHMYTFHQIFKPIQLLSCQIISLESLAIIY